MAKHGFKLDPKGELADEIGKLDARIEALIEKRAKLEKKLARRTGTFSGLQFKAVVFDRWQAWLDSAKVKRLIGEKAFRKCMSGKEIRVVRVQEV